MFFPTSSIFLAFCTAVLPTTCPAPVAPIFARRCPLARAQKNVFFLSFTATLPWAFSLALTYINCPSSLGLFAFRRVFPPMPYTSSVMYQKHLPVNVLWCSFTHLFAEPPHVNEVKLYGISLSARNASSNDHAFLTLVDCFSQP